ncbi:hypothetical protein JCM8097_003055 [Rhodosporidiobolus ruineniae]
MPAVDRHTALGKGMRASSAPLDADQSYRARRNQILRSLGRSSARNGSQFAILWVTPSGQHTEVFASEGLASKLNLWLGPQVQQDAKDGVRRSRLERDARTRQGLHVYPGDTIFGPNADPFDARPLEGEGSDEEEGGARAQAAVPAKQAQHSNNYDEFLPTPTRPGSVKPSPNNLPSPALPSSSRITRSNSSSHLPSLQQASPAPSPSSAPSPATAPSPFGAPSNGPSRPPTPLVPWHFTPQNLPGWYESRFNEMLHKTDKQIAKAWIKLIEPHKASLAPYHKGEAVKPEWWPEEVRHKEPDHLNKPERIILLMHLLRSGPRTTDELEQALLELNAKQLSPENLAVTREICRVAKEEKKAVQRCGSAFSVSPYFFLPLTFSFTDGTFDSFTVVLGGFVPPPPKYELKQEEEEEPRQHNTRHRTRRSIGNVDSLSASQPPQQTPRSSARASPYPLSRSHSVSDALSGNASPVRSPALGASTSAATGMSRSQSQAGPISSAGKPRNARQNGRHSLGEADLLDPSSAAFVPGADSQTTPYASRIGAGRPSVTPRQGQASPLATGMSRSYSTSALGGSSGPPSPATKKAAMIDDAVASPAMIKSRSRLSQQHFDQMGLGKKAASAKGPRQSQPSHPPRQQQPVSQHPPQSEQHASGPPQRPPLQHAHTQPLPHGHHPQPHHIAHVQQYPPPHPQQQHVLVYAPPPGLVRQPSSGGHPIAVHPAHQLSLPPQAHFQPHPHHLQQHPHVQVQVQVHAGHALPPEYEQQLAMQQQMHLQHQHHQQQQQSQHLQVQNGVGAGAYPSPSTATFAPGAPSPNPSGSPFLYDQQQHSQHSQQSFTGHDAFLVAGSADAALYPGSAGGSTAASPMPLHGASLSALDYGAGGGVIGGAGDASSTYGTSPLLASASASGSGAHGHHDDLGMAGVGMGEDLSAYVEQLEQCMVQQQSSSAPPSSAPGDGFGGLGLGLGLGAGGDTVMGLEAGYYGDDGFGVVGA